MRLPTPEYSARALLLHHHYFSLIVDLRKNSLRPLKPRSIVDPLSLVTYQNKKITIRMLRHNLTNARALHHTNKNMTWHWAKLHDNVIVCFHVSPFTHMSFLILVLCTDCWLFRTMFMNDNISIKVVDRTCMYLELGSHRSNLYLILLNLFCPYSIFSQGKSHNYSIFMF